MASQNRDLMISGVSPDLVERLDRLVREMAARDPGLKVSRSSVGRMLLLQALGGAKAG